MTYGRAHVWAIAAAPHDPAALYAAGTLGLYRSADCGRSWSAPPLGAAGSAEALAIGPDGTLYHGTSWETYASVDGGRAWERGDRMNMAPTGIVVAPSDPLVVYITGLNSLDRVLGRRLMSTVIRGTRAAGDAAVHWEEITWSRPRGRLIVAPGDADTLYVLGEGGRQVSRDGGWSFEAEPADPAAPIPRLLAAAPTADGSRVWAIDGTGALLASTDLGRTWEERGRLPDQGGWVDALVRGLSPSAFDPAVVYVAISAFIAMDNNDRAGIWVFRDR